MGKGGSNGTPPKFNTICCQHFSCLVIAKLPVQTGPLLLSFD